MKLTEIFTSFMGEHSILGIGASVIIVRTNGCNLNCWGGCDTPEALGNKANMSISVDKIFEKIKRHSVSTGCKNVMLTGGEPLLQNTQELFSIIDKMVDSGFRVVIKTNGTVDIKLFCVRGVYFVVDYKNLPSISEGRTGYTFNIDPRNLTQKDVIQYVVKSELDYEKAVSSIQSIKECSQVVFSMGSFWGEDSLSPLDIFNKLKHDSLLDDVRMNFQVHKLAQFQSELSKKILLKSI